VSRFAILAASRTGSTWVNHVFSSHPCIVSSDEYLMRHSALLSVFHRDASGVKEVLHNLSFHGLSLLRKRRGTDNAAARCKHMAAGVKLKLIVRDVTFGDQGNSNLVLEGLRMNDWKIIMLQRRNTLDSFLAFNSRAISKRLHCPVGQCNPFSLNATMMLSCNKTVLAMREFEEGNVQIDGSKSVSGPAPLCLDYEDLLIHSAGFVRGMRLIGFNTADSCLLRAEFMKRVQQTQREMISNFDEISRCLQEAGPAFARHLHADVRPPPSGPLPVESAKFCPDETFREPTRNWGLGRIPSRDDDSTVL